MSGKDLMKGMGYVDEKYIAEAETASIRKPKIIPWAKRLAVASCLCICVVGLFRLDRNFRQDNSVENASDIQLPGETLEIRPEFIQSSEENSENLTEVPSVVLRVESWQEDGFVGTVAQLVDTDLFKIGTELNVIIEKDVCAENSSVQDSKNSPVILEDREPEKMDFPAGSLVCVQFVSYDEQTHTIHVNMITPADMAD